MTLMNQQQISVHFSAFPQSLLSSFFCQLVSSVRLFSLPSPTWERHINYLWHLLQQSLRGEFHVGYFHSLCLPKPWLCMPRASVISLTSQNKLPMVKETWAAGCLRDRKTGPGFTLLLVLGRLNVRQWGKPTACWAVPTEAQPVAGGKQLLPFPQPQG